MSLRGGLFVLICAVTLLYPFIIYEGIAVLGPSFLAKFLLLLVLGRVLLRGEFRKPGQWVQLVSISALCLLAAWLESESLLRFYPVVMNLAFAALFLFSLFTPQPLIERFARMFSREVPPHAIHYLRNLTKLWALLLLLNATVSAYTACCVSLQTWTLYNGVVVYCLFLAFMAVEYLYRRRYRRKLVQKAAQQEQLI